MIQKMLRTITQQYHLEGLDPGEFQKMKISGMTFNIWSFHAQGLGHVSAMEARGFFGLMKMDTLIINPTQVDMPLYSYDRVHVMGNDTLIFELYDTLVGNTSLSVLDAVKAQAKDLPDHDLGQHWYDPIKLPVSLSKKGKKVHSPDFDAVTMEYLSAYLACAKEAESCREDAKREKASHYVEGLLANGGPSTDVFKKGIGDTKTAALFRKVLFGTEA